MSKSHRYTPAPEVPAEMKERYQKMLEVLTGKLTVSEAARQLGISRNHFQHLLHRGLEGFIQAAAPKPAGRKGKSEEQTRLEEENARLRRENQRLQEQALTVDRMLGVVSEVVSGRARLRRTKPSPTRDEGEGSDEPDGALARAERMKELGVPAPLCAVLCGIGASTLRRWRARHRAGLPPRLKALRARRNIEPSLAAAASAHVRLMNGEIGAAALGRYVGLSRRGAAEVKARTLTRMEHERRAGATRVQITTPGVVRGFDAMHLKSTEGRRYLLTAADACVPFRTSGRLEPMYDDVAVEKALAADFEGHGPPLVARLDRASVHRTSRIADLMSEAKVLMLHGPPRHPQYYGQLERQNREHRAWLKWIGTVDESKLAAACLAMLDAFNSGLPRASLNWATASDRWTSRPEVRDDRDELREEVNELAAKLREQSCEEELAERLAIEQALINRGHLVREAGGWC